MLKNAVFGLGIVVFSAAMSGAGAAPLYSLTDLGTLGGASSFALDVNNARQVTGSAQTPVGQPNPRLNTFLWSEPGPMANLGVLPGSNNFSRGYAINDSGVVVGESDNNNSRAFVYSGGVMSGLTRLAGDNDRGVAHDINNAGVIVGISSNGTASRPTQWTAGVATDLGSLDGLTSTTGRAWGINDTGQVVGFSRRDTATTVSQATLWNAPGSPVNLGSLQADSFSEAFAINEGGVAVGAAVNGTTPGGTSIRQAVRWVFDGADYDIFALGSLGRTFSEAKDINDQGQIVGFATNISGSAQRAFIWEDGLMTDLNSLVDPTLGFTLMSAEGINDRGDIVGFGTIGGVTHAFLLTPVPAPGAWALLLAGLGGMRFVRRRTNRAAAVCPAAAVAPLRLPQLQTHAI